MRMTLRLRDATSAAITAAAKREGIAPGRWVANLIERELSCEPTIEHGRGGKECLHPTPRAKVNLRIQQATLKDLDRVANEAELTRSQWILRAVQAVLYDRYGLIRPVPQVRQLCRDMMATVSPIGRNVNQAVRKISAFVDQGVLTPADRAALMNEIEKLYETRREMVEHVQAIQEGISYLAGGNYIYWTARLQTGEDVEK